VSLDPDEFRRRARALASIESRIETTIAVARSLDDEATLAACDEQMRRLEDEAMTGDGVRSCIRAVCWCVKSVQQDLTPFGTRWAPLFWERKRATERPRRGPQAFPRATVPAPGEVRLPRVRSACECTHRRSV
jgi:hypothetical protein